MRWTPEMESKLRRLWASEMSGSRIAAEIGGGLSRSAVIAQAHRLGLGARASGYQGSWTPERTARLRELHATGGELPWIAAQLGGVSAEAVKTKLERLGLGIPRKATRGSDSGTAHRLKKRVALAGKPAAAAVKLAPLIASSSNSALFIEARFAQCRFVLDADAPIETRLICGNPTDGGSWCPACQKRVFSRHFRRYG